MTNINFLITEYANNIINSMTDSLIVLNPEASIMAINNSTEKLLGYTKKEIIGKPAGSIIVDKNMSFFNMIRDLIEKGALYNYDMEYKAKDNSKIPVSFCGAVLKDKDNNIVGVIGVARDMRETKRLISELEIAKSSLERRVEEKTHALVMAKEKTEEAYNKLKSAQTQLLQQEKMSSIGQLAAGVAHEINNPIGFINSNLGTLKEYVTDLKPLFDKYNKLLETADTSPLKDEINNIKETIDLPFILSDMPSLLDESKDGANRVKDIVKNLKDFSHIDDSELKLADINAGLDSTLNIVWNELKYKCTVKKDYGDIGDIQCYPMELNQVFMNLFINSAQSIEKKGDISIKTYTKDKHMHIEISDTGSGIKKENLEHIFEPFFTTKEVGKGTGLGLSMAYGIIQKHKGKIQVDSEVGKGTTFHIILPVG